MSRQTTGRLVGALFLSAFACYGIGSALAGRFAGTVLVLLNSVIVAAIGILVLRALREPHPRAAWIYLVARVAEAILLASGAVLLTGAADVTYQVAMLALGLGSLPFCVALMRSRWLPGWLAIWGLAGYALLAAGAMAELMGYGVGLALSVPGGIFEVIFGLTLLYRGFAEPSPVSRSTPPRLRRAALTAGLGLLLMAVLAALANFGVLEPLVTGDAAGTTRNLLRDQLALQLAIAALSAVALLDVVVAWALWVFFDHVHRATAIVAAWCRIVYAVIFGVAISHLVAAAILLRDTAPDRRSDDVFAQIGQFQDVWNAGLAIFGVHLLLVGWLAWRSSSVPRVLAVLVAIAGAGYLADSVGRLLSATYTFELTAVTFIGEVALMVWLLIYAARRRISSPPVTTTENTKQPELV